MDLAATADADGGTARTRTPKPADFDAFEAPGIFQVVPRARSGSSAPDGDRAGAAGLFDGAAAKDQDLASRVGVKRCVTPIEVVVWCRASFDAQP